MKLISENLHIISKSIKEAILAKDANYIKDLLFKLTETNPDWIDLNIAWDLHCFCSRWYCIL